MYFVQKLIIWTYNFQRLRLTAASPHLHSCPRAGTSVVCCGLCLLGPMPYRIRICLLSNTPNKIVLPVHEILPRGGTKGSIKDAMEEGWGQKLMALKH